MGATVSTCNTSRILSAISTSCYSEKSVNKDARTMRAGGGRHCKNSCLTNVLSCTGAGRPTDVACVTATQKACSLPAPWL